jgi:leader peptidase (prepilin peptidase) / N-methyltransferase
MEQLSTASAEQAPVDGVVDGAARSTPPAWAVFAAAVLAVGTVVRLGFSLNSLAWAAVQVVLVGVTAYDLTNRRVKNAVTVPVSVLALLLRAAFERSAFVEVIVTGLVAFLAFFALALILRGGLGMGDVKLAAMLGFLLGEKVLPALFIGAIAGGVAGAFLLTRSTGRRATMAYGPYLALGGALVILLAHPPHLI